MQTFEQLKLLHTQSYTLDSNTGQCIAYFGTCFCYILGILLNNSSCGKGGSIVQVT